MGAVVVCGKVDVVCAGHAGGPIAGVQTIPVFVVPVVVPVEVELLQPWIP